jgi:tRNA (guanosine-2'-O-)-methyltransferase
MVDEKLLNYLEGFLTDKRKSLFKKVLENRTRHFTVVLEDIFQSHNASAVVRTCDIFGVQDVHAIENKYNNKVSRHVAKGSQKWLNQYRYRNDGDNTKTCLDALKEKGYQIIATTPHNDSCELQDFDITKKTAFVFGVEAEGVSDYVLENADGFLKIPMDPALVKAHPSRARILRQLNSLLLGPCCSPALLLSCSYIVIV